MSLITVYYFGRAKDKPQPMIYNLYLFTLAVTTKGILGLLIPTTLALMLRTKFVLTGKKINKNDLILLA